jgi:hypothetical protein
MHCSVHRDEVLEVVCPTVLTRRDVVDVILRPSALGRRVALVVPILDVRATLLCAPRNAVTNRDFRQARGRRRDRLTRARVKNAWIRPTCRVYDRRIGLCSWGCTSSGGVGSRRCQVTGFGVGSGVGLQPHLEGGAGDGPDHNGSADRNHLDTPDTTPPLDTHPDPFWAT